MSPDIVEDQGEAFGEAAVLVEAPAGPQGDGAQRVEVVAQPLLGARVRWGGWWGSSRLFGTQVEHRLLHDAFALGGIGAAPGRGQPAQLPRAHRGWSPSKPINELRAVSFLGPGQGHEMAHCAVRTEPPLTHEILGLLRQLADQGQPSRHPALRMSHEHGQLRLTDAVTLDELRQQPALLQRRALLRRLLPMCQAKRLHLVERQHHHRHRVVPELLQGGDPLVAVDQHVAPGMIDLLDHHHRALLAVLADRRHELRSSLWVADAGRPVGQLELVKFQLHRGPSMGMARLWDCAPPGRCLTNTPMNSCCYASIWDCTAVSRSLPNSYEVSKSCTLDWDCATSRRTRTKIPRKSAAATPISS